MGFSKKYLLVIGFIILINQDGIESGAGEKVSCSSKNITAKSETSHILDKGRKFFTENLHILPHTKIFLD